MLCCHISSFICRIPAGSFFDVVQHKLLQLKFELNARFANKSTSDNPVFTLKGNIKTVHAYKYLGSLLDVSLSFKRHIQNLVKILKIKLGFFFQNKIKFSFEVKKRLATATFKKKI